MLVAKGVSDTAGGELLERVAGRLLRRRGLRGPGVERNRRLHRGRWNSAGQAALHLARYARRVTLMVRADSLAAGMSYYLVRDVEGTPNVEVRTGTAVVGGGGEGHLQELVLRNSATGEEDTVAADALFVLIGARPHTDGLPEEIARDERGFLWTGEEVTDARDWPLERRPFSLETSMPGLGRPTEAVAPAGSASAH